MADLGLKLGLFSDSASPAFSDLSQCGKKLPSLEGLGRGCQEYCGRHLGRLS